MFEIIQKLNAPAPPTGLYSPDAPLSSGASDEGLYVV